MSNFFFHQTIRLYRASKVGLRLCLIVQCKSLRLIQGVTTQYAMADHGCALPLTPDASVELVIEVKAPIQPEPYNRVSVCLESVQAMSDTGAMTNQ